jgi:hypothetical protein
MDKDDDKYDGEELRAGPLRMRFQNGDLRYIKWGEREILRRVYAAVRDRNWGTVPVQISDLKFEIQAASFQISYEATHREGEIDFVWHGEIVGDETGTIRFTFDGEARSTFLRNRIGICVLHPLRECAGQPCVVEYADGAIESGHFPQLIAPHQPFKNMRAISHEIQPGLSAEVRLEGDIFEIEDQRNWTDGSFKTYSTPLELPFPVEVKQGTRIAQSFALRLKGEAPPALLNNASPEVVTLTVGDTPAGRLPRIGLGVASHEQPLNSREITLLRALHLSHLRVDLHLNAASCEAALRRATNEARALQVNLEIALFFSAPEEEEQLRGLAAIVRRLNPPVATSAKWIAQARQTLQPYDPAAGFGGGTNAYFAELNRQRPTAQTLELTDAIVYSINPQVHAVDNASLIETLETQAATVASARQFLGNKPLMISPITLKPRANPNATAPAAAADSDGLPPAVDARQMSLFAAAWTAGSLKYLAESGVESVTFYETTGWRGVMETEKGSPLLELFPAPPGAVFPLYHVLADVGEFAAGEIIPLSSSDPLKVLGLAMRRDGQTRLLLCNLSGLTQPLVVCNLTGQAVLKRMDEEGRQAAMLEPELFRHAPGESLLVREGQLEIRLRPHEIVRLDYGNSRARQ